MIKGGKKDDMMGINAIELLPTLMAERSKALPLTASCLLQLSRFISYLGHVRKLPMTQG